MNGNNFYGVLKTNWLFDEWRLYRCYNIGKALVKIHFIIDARVCVCVCVYLLVCVCVCVYLLVCVCVYVSEGYRVCVRERDQ